MFTYVPNPSWVFFYVASCIFSLQLYNVISYLWVSLMSVSSVQSLSHVRLSATPWIAACQASLSITNSWSLLKLMSIESVMPSSHLILCHPLLLLPPIPPSIRVFSNESTLHMRWPKYCSITVKSETGSLSSLPKVTELGKYTTSF